MLSPAERLPDFPWDLLAPFGERARAFPGGIVDLSIGTPVDSTPEIVQRALRDSADAHGYPTTVGTPDLRRSCADWVQRTLGATVSTDAILPTIGSKEFIALLPTLLGLGPDSHVIIPTVAYPTYAVGAALAGARITATDSPETADRADLIWINSPSNPTGEVLSAERLRELVAYARATGALLVSDECYIELGWDAEPISVLHPSVSGDDHSGVLAVHSLSKRSSLAGYRFGFTAGDHEVLRKLLVVRKHLGLMVPAPVQHAAAVAYADDAHVAAQRDRYRGRRQILADSLRAHGFTIDHGEAGLYLWTTRDQPCWETVSWFADRGILVTPGDFYGTAGARHVRIAFTATDAAVEAFAERLAQG
jgi:succinyldiaminopimelate transaminase